MSCSVVVYANTKSFFDIKQYATKEKRRSGLSKWKTVLHSRRKMRGGALKNPVFDIHYNAREAGHKATAAEQIRYALITTLEAAKHANLYKKISRPFANTLVPIQQQVSFPFGIR